MEIPLRDHNIITIAALCIDQMASHNDMRNIMRKTFLDSYF